MNARDAEDAESVVGTLADLIEDADDFAEGLGWKGVKTRTLSGDRLRLEITLHGDVGESLTVVLLAMEATRTR